MVRQGKNEIVQSFIEKILREFAPRKFFLNAFLKKLSKIKGIGKEFMESMVRKAAMKEIDPKI